MAQIDYDAGYCAGITAFAWWHDGQQMVGTTGMTLHDALTHFAALWNYAPQTIDTTEAQETLHE